MSSYEIITLVIFVSLLRGLELIDAGQCPAVCHCLGNTVDCSQNSLISIPNNLPDWTEVLYLNGNLLNSTDFSVLSALQGLIELRLSNNHLGSIPHSLPPNITQLNLAHNEISMFDRTAVSGLSGIRILDLSFNRISQLPNAALILPSLTHLYLNGNNIVSIDRGAFDNLTSLEGLKLSRNKIKTLQKNTFASLKHLKFLELERNRLQTIEGLVFEGLRSLVTLKLKRNDIHLLMDGAFWGLSSLENLDLSSNNISFINNKWLYGLQTLQKLTLSHNSISEIDKDSWIYCSNLSELDLRFNKLVYLRKGSFKGLNSLIHLQLGHNRLSYIDNEGFKGLSALITLDLSYNDLSWTIEDGNGTFDSLPALNRLMLQNNHIKSLWMKTFAQLSDLEQLHLQENKISSVQNNTFSAATRLKELWLNSSHLLCDCNLSWLPGWLKQTGLDQTTELTCYYPPALNGKNLFDVHQDEFICDKYARPVITVHPGSVKALRSGNVTLVCEAVSKSSEKFNIEWKRDNEVLKGVFEMGDEVETDGLFTVSSSLIIDDVTDEHAGTYQCIASNLLGSSFSSRALLSVNVYPSFIKTPNDVVVKIGTTARLDCAASGLPVPEIALQKDGGDDFPAARERRMHIYPSDEVFFIVDVKPEDEGVYSCIAQNDVGLIRANASLSVLEPPTLVRRMSDKMTAEGETTVLECMTSGKPRPRLYWLKDTAPLNLTSSSRHHITAEGQLLVIVQTRRSDAGTYTCVVSNALGSDRHIARITVIDPITGAVLAEPEVASSQQSNEQSVSVTVGIVIIAVVCCVVATSLVWVIVIYKSRHRRRDGGVGVCCCVGSSGGTSRSSQVHKVVCYADAVLKEGERYDAVRDRVVCYHPARSDADEDSTELVSAHRLLSGPTHSFSNVATMKINGGGGCPVYRSASSSLSSSAAGVALMKGEARRHSDYISTYQHSQHIPHHDGGGGEEEEEGRLRERSDSGTHTAGSSLSGSSTEPSDEINTSHTMLQDPPATQTTPSSVQATPSSLMSSALNRSKDNTLDNTSRQVLDRGGTCRDTLTELPDSNISIDRDIQSNSKVCSNDTFPVTSSVLVPNKQDVTPPSDNHVIRCGVR